MNIEVEKFSEVVASYVDSDGYPISFPARVRIEKDTIIVERPKYLTTAKRVTILFNHITPLQTGGYTDRRYMMVKGAAEDKNDHIMFRPLKSFGWDEKKTPFFQYCEEKTRQAKKYLTSLSKNLGKPVKPHLPLYQLLFRATRFPFLTATVVPVLIGVATAAYLGFLEPWLFLLTLIGASLIHLALNMTNDYFDSKLGADEANITPTPFSGGSRIIQYGLLTADQMISMAASFYISGIVIGIYLALTRGLVPVLSVMALGVLISIFYTAPPFKLAYRGLGELAVGVGFGPIVVLGSHYVQTQTFSIEALLASIPIGIFIALILYVNEIPDAPYDAASGKRTLVTRLSMNQVINLYKALLMIAYGMVVLPVIIGLAPPTSLIALSTIPKAFKTVKAVAQTYGNPYLMIPALTSNIQVATLTGFLHAIGFFTWSAMTILLK